VSRVGPLTSAITAGAKAAIEAPESTTPSISLAPSRAPKLA
jgi:hypothetical protein